MRWQVNHLPTSACKVREAEEQGTERLSEDFGGRLLVFREPVWQGGGVGSSWSLT